MRKLRTARNEVRKLGTAVGFASALGICVTAACTAAAADPALGPGVTDNTIELGQTMPYSGPYSMFGVLGQAQRAYFEMLNDQGGINGRKIDLVSLDDEYSPPKTLAQTRKLIESDQVLAIVGSVGTGPALAARKYLNTEEVPQIFVYAGLSGLADPAEFPWTMIWLPTNHAEAAAYAKYLLQHKPDAKVAVLYQQGDAGKSFYDGVVAGLGEKASSIIVKVATYEATDPTVDSQIVSLQASGADTLIEFSGPKTVAQSIRKAADIGWKPLHFVTYSTASAAVLKSAGEGAVGTMSAAFLKDPADPAWTDDPAVKDMIAWKDRYLSGVSLSDLNVVSGYTIAQAVAKVLEQCGDDLTRKNFMMQATHLDEVSLPMLLPGITISTSPTDYQPLERLRLQRFDGERWELLPEQ